MELIDLYPAMYKARAFELSLAELWRQGLISGELHLGTGEEAIAAGLTVHMKKGDGIALDHRSTPFLSLLGVDLALMIKEMLGRSDGLCSGMAGHMHLSSVEHLAAASGIVGAAGPLAAGFALAAKSLRPGCVGVAVFGEGAVNEGMMMEAQNLASAWSLPAIFVCKDNGWAITTRSASVTGGDPVKRAEAMGLFVQGADGLDPIQVWKAAGQAFAQARRGGGPQFLHLTCSRLDGHFLGDPLLQTARKPFAEGSDNLKKVISAIATGRGGSITEKTAGLVAIMKTLARARKDDSETSNDPVWRARRALRGRAEEVARIEKKTDELITEAIAVALGGGK